MRWNRSLAPSSRISGLKLGTLLQQLGTPSTPPAPAAPSLLVLVRMIFYRQLSVLRLDTSWAHCPCMPCLSCFRPCLKPSYPSLSFPILPYPSLSFPILPYPSLSFPSVQWWLYSVWPASSLELRLQNAADILCSSFQSPCVAWIRWYEFSTPSQSFQTEAAAEPIHQTWKQVLLFTSSQRLSSFHTCSIIYSMFTIRAVLFVAPTLISSLVEQSDSSKASQCLPQRSDGAMELALSQHIELSAATSHFSARLLWCG